MRRIFLIIVTFVFFPRMDTIAQEANNNFEVNAPIIIGEKISIQSYILGEERSILISLPEGYHQSNEKYPVLYMMDGESYFTLVRGIVNFLVGMNWMPDIIIVAINNTDRMRDLTPTNVPVYVVSEEIKKEWPTSGGADQFIHFLKKELFKIIESQFRTMPFKICTGHSLGGLFGFYTLSASPGLFNATIAIGPSLWWDDRIVTLKLKKFFEKTKILNHILFFSLATEDLDEDDPVPSVQMRSVLNANIPKGFSWQFSDLTDETHESAVLRGLYYGLSYVFQNWRLPIDPVAERYTGDVAGLKDFYEKVFNGVGFRPPEGQVNIIALQRLNRKLYDEAIEFFKYNIRLYPQSAGAFNGLGNALEQSDRLKEALANYKKAVELGEKNKDNNLGQFKINRDRVLDALKK